MRLVFLGPPGVGKGTQAERLAKEFGMCHISTGDMFREAIERGTEVGLRAKRFLDAGELVPDDVVTGALRERVSQGNCERGFVLDGFPRTMNQARSLEGILSDRAEVLDGVVYFSAPEEVLVERLSGRRMCRGCGANFHVKFNPSAREGVCDKCGGELYSRSDDAPDTVRKRLRVYLRSTAALVDHYRSLGLLVEISAASAADEVARQTRCALSRNCGIGGKEAR